jgi:hypothetical protein
VSVSNLIPYGDAIGRAVWNYFGISDYLKLRWSGFREGEATYNEVDELWRNARERDRYDNGELKLRQGRVVKLIDFNFTEWFPWMPGMYWTDFGIALRDKGSQHRVVKLDDNNSADERDESGSPLLTPWGKTLNVLSGVGGVRMNMFEGERADESIQVLGATTASGYNLHPNVSGGVPVVMSKNAYREIQRQIESQGVVKATVEGIYIDIPEILGDVFFRLAQDIPRFCIYVGSGRTIRDVREGDDVITAGWSIFEEEGNRSYSMAFCSFAAADEEGLIEAGHFLTDYIVSRYNGRPLTDFDEKTPRLPAIYPITRIKQADINMRFLQDLLLKIYRKYPTNNLNEVVSRIHRDPLPS